MADKVTEVRFEEPILAERSKDDKSKSSKRTPKRIVKIPLDKYTYATKLRGRLVAIRENRPPTIFTTAWKCLKEYINKRSALKEDSKVEQAKSTGVENNPVQIQLPIISAPQIPPFDPNDKSQAATTSSAMMPSVGANGPISGILRQGDRQFALLPVASPPVNSGFTPAAPSGTSPATSQQPVYAYPPQVVLSPVPTVAGYNYPPMGYDPQQFLTNPQLANAPAPQTSVTITKHVCAKCGNIRSEKYHHQNPIKLGEVPEPAFCRNCKKHLKPTEGSDDEKMATKQDKKSKKRGYMGKHEGITASSKGSSRSLKSTQSASTKYETKSTQTEDMIIDWDKVHSSKTSISSTPRAHRYHQRRHHHDERHSRDSQISSSPHLRLTHQASKHSSSKQSSLKHSSAKQSSSRRSSPEQSSSTDNPTMARNTKYKRSKGSNLIHSSRRGRSSLDDKRKSARYKAQEDMLNDRNTETSGIESNLSDRPDNFYDEQGMQSQSRVGTRKKGKQRKISKISADTKGSQSRIETDPFVTRSDASTTTISSSEALRRQEADLVAKDLGLGNGTYFSLIRRYDSPSPPRRRRHRQETGEGFEPQITPNAPSRIKRSSQRMGPEPKVSEHYREDWSRTAHVDPIPHRIHSHDLDQEWPSGPSHRYEQNTGYESTNNSNDMILPPDHTTSRASGSRYQNKTRDTDQYDYTDDSDSSQGSNIARTSFNERNRTRETTQRTRNFSHYRSPYVRDATDRDSEQVFSRMHVHREPTENIAMDFVSSPPRSLPGQSRGHKQSWEQTSFSEEGSGITEEIERAERHVTWQNFMAHDHGSSGTQGRRPSWAARVESLF